jgi:hypothetical protein
MSENRADGKQAGQGIRPGLWRGKLGSTLSLEIDGQCVSGRFQTAHGSPQFSEVFDVTGFTDGEFIGFVVLWHGHHSITSWTGRYGRDELGEYIRLMWQLAHKYHDRERRQPTEEWDFIISNCNQLYYAGPL